MTSGYSSNRNLELMATGEDLGIWGNKTNTNLTLLDLILGGRYVANLNGLSGGFLVSVTAAQNMLHTLTGAPAGNIVYTLPPSGSYYFIANQTTGSRTITVAMSGGGATVVIGQGQTFLVFVNPDATTGVIMPQGAVGPTGPGNPYIVVTNLVTNPPNVNNPPLNPPTGLLVADTSVPDFTGYAAGPTGPAGPIGPTGPSAPILTFDLTIPGSTGNLLATAGNVYVHNTSGAAVTVVPPGSPAEGLLFTIIDADGNAGNWPISFQGFTDPIIRVSGGTAAVQFHSGSWYRIR